MNDNKRQKFLEWATEMVTAELVFTPMLPRSSDEHKTVVEIVEKLIPQFGMLMPTIYVADSPQLNAWTMPILPVDVVVVNSRMVQEFNVDELAYVIGHELGHIKLDHSYKSYLAGPHGKLGYTDIERLQEELDADIVGADAAMAAGFQPRAYETAMDKLFLSRGSNSDDAEMAWRRPRIREYLAGKEAK